MADRRKGGPIKIGREAKYHNRKIVTPEGKWDSMREYRRHCELAMLAKAGEITGLREQVRYELIPAQRAQPSEVYQRGPLRGQPKPGKVLERAVDYIADFVYKTKDGQVVVEDTKGRRTKDYIIKRKLMLWIHGIQIREV